MKVLFAIGLGIELAGATLLAWEAMTTVRGTFTSAATAEEQKPRSRAVVGFGLLALGVVVQLVGLAVHDLWLHAIAAGTIVVAIIVGRWLGDGPVWRAITHYSWPYP
jgi:predicted lysophospholipase L1 biosynthesis ABC-type transport system permease subunit